MEKPYLVEVPVASQAAADRKLAENNGLQLLLERLTGQPLADNAAVRAASVESVLLRVGYAEDKSRPAPELEVDAPPPVWLLRLEFSPTAVAQLMREAGLSLWPLDRPQLLVALVDENGMPLSADVSAAFERQARVRGLPVRMAAADVVAAAQGSDPNLLAGALAGSGADALLLVRLAGSDAAGWQAESHLRFHEQDSALQQQGASLDAAFASLTQQVAAQLSASYRNSVTADTGTVLLRVQVDNVQDYATYQRVREFLEKLDAVQRVNIVQVKGATVIADIDAKGRESFRALVALFRNLQWQEEILPPPGSDAGVRTQWRYRWVE